MQSKYFFITIIVFILLVSLGVYAQEDIPPATLSQLCRNEALIEQSPNEAEKAKREKLYAQLLGVLQELGRYRQEFLQKENLINLFPTAYYHTTLAEMLNIASGKYQYPIEKMQQMLAFFDAYQYNRESWDQYKNAEEHWEKHFIEAENTWNILLTGVKSVLGTGIDAHVNYDLARALRESFKNRYHQNLSALDLKPDFDQADAIFQNTVHATNKDLYQIYPNAQGWIDLGNLLFGGTQQGNVLTFRRNAWLQAFLGEEIIGANGNPLASQPQLAHESYENKGKTLCENTVLPILFLFDASGSMQENNKMTQAQQAALQTLESIQQEQKQTLIPTQVAVWVFSGDCSPTSTRKICDFQSDLTEVARLIRTQLPQPGGNTPLPNAVEVAQKNLQSYITRNGLLNQGSLVILSDGLSTCGTVRPPDVYSTGQKQTPKVPQSSNSLKTIPGLKYHTVGFDIAPGSEAERDLQYLASNGQGKYYAAQNEQQLTRAFQKSQRQYLPKLYPSLTNIPLASDLIFNSGRLAIQMADYKLAQSQFEQYLNLHPQDANAIYNTALVNEIQEKYATALSHYSAYLRQAPQANDFALVESWLNRLEQDAEDRQSFLINTVQSDLQYLQDYYNRLFTQNNASLATEFAGFIREKKEFYKLLPTCIEPHNPKVEKLAVELSQGFAQVAQRLGQPSFDRDAVSLLSIPLGVLEELSSLF